MSLLQHLPTQKIPAVLYSLNNESYDVPIEKRNTAKEYILRISALVK